MTRFRPLAPALVAACVLVPVALAADAVPEIVEQAGATLVQVDVSVLDPKLPSRASVRGLAAGDFDVRVEGRRVGLEGPDRLIVDEICEASPEQPALRPVIVVVDFNYVDAAGRIRVAEAIDRLAAAPVPGLVYKFYGLTREVRSLADGFLADPAKIREVAALVRSSDFTGDRTVPPYYLTTMRRLLAEGGAGGCSG
jgi:hypothetical protein